MNFLRSKRKIIWIHPSNFFITESPSIPLPNKLGDYHDLSEVGTTSYLQILPSIALYGYKYVVMLDDSLRVIDGNYRAYCGLELNERVPCMIAKNREDLPYFLYMPIWKLRKFIKKKYLFRRKISNPNFKHPNKPFLPCRFQKNIIR